ncbi:hypothetical protein OMP38_12875 [Cohnella ginsengisoli]|uniref:Pilus assembly protein TadE n=1 Tax=Cohnella ginsengisoli TaxID=425004 RepID=A0A9X4KHK6_9BACL|nr:hypothetical protein [Cohnella ginsengisoli]MDG0791664.1 hypothetical protein [Cohnella ginsengisoli]
MLMPTLLIVTFLLLFYALFTAQNAIVHYKSAVAAERAAFNWSHAESEFATGAYEDGRYDGLYWRLTDDALLQGLFGWTADESADSLTFPGATDPGDRLTLRKLHPAVEAMAVNWRGSIRYERGGLQREIAVSAEDPGELSPLALLRGSSVASSESSAPVTEPAEWMRTFDLVRYYTGKVKREGGGAETYIGKAGSILGRKADAQSQ